MLGWNYTWEHGRQLASMSGSGTTWSFDYNTDGMRYKRTNGSTTYTYYYNGDLLRYLDINGTKLYFVLDADGKPIEVSYKPANSTTTSFYFYVHNLQGDVIAIVDTNGSTVVQYTYDAWGKLLSTTGSMASTLGQQNPFRYRSYVYDHETGLYYLQSRYYNPSVGRFINADAFVSTGQGILGNNMFAYCRNNPVIRKDASGTEDVTVEDCNQDNNPLNDLGNPTGGGGGGFWSSFTRSLQSATDGLKMAMGERNMTVSERHHLFTNKNKVYTPQFKEIMERYDMSLNANENIVVLEGHKGRYTKVYHDVMLFAITELASIAKNNPQIFAEGMEVIKAFLQQNPGLPYAKK